MKGFIMRALGFFKRNYGRIAYYGGVLAVLAALAIAADAQRENPANDLVLPEADIRQTVAQILEEQRISDGEGMEILRSYSEEPEWNADLGHWEAHPATDCRTADGVVRSLCSGTVMDIGESGVYGGYVEVECGEYLFCYASIVLDEDLKAGDELKIGDRIGVAENGMPGERNMGDHLHLEVYERGRSIDFASLATKNRVGTD